jgi:hypothetical protein
VVLVDHQHTRFKSVLSLQLQLSGFALLFSFVLKDRKFRSVTFLLFIHFNLSCNDIRLDPLNHVLVLTLLHQLEVAGHFDFLHFLLRLHYAIRFVEHFIFDYVLLCLLLLKLPFDLFEFLLFGFYLATGQVVLLS